MRRVTIVNEASMTSGVGVSINLIYKVIANLNDVRLMNIQFGDGNFLIGNVINKVFIKNKPVANRILTSIWRIKVPTNQLTIAGDGLLVNFLRNVPEIAVIHHCNILLNKENYPWFAGILLRKTLIRLEKAGSTVLTFSEWTRNLVLQFSKILDSRVVVIHPYVDLPHPTNVDIVDTMMKYNIPKENLVIAVGTSVVHKNFKTLYDAVRGTNINVIRVGGNQTMEIQQHGEIPPNVAFIGKADLNRQELASLYKMADLLAFTGTDEGFGFPMIEAFSMGTPVVGNKCTSVPEILGEDQLLVNDPFNPIELRDAIYKMIENRLYYASKASERSRMYSMKQCQSDLRDLLEKFDMN